MQTGALVYGLVQNNYIIYYYDFSGQHMLDITMKHKNTLVLCCVKHWPNTATSVYIPPAVDTPTVGIHPLYIQYKTNAILTVPYLYIDQCHGMGMKHHTIFFSLKVILFIHHDILIIVNNVSSTQSTFPNLSSLLNFS